MKPLTECCRNTDNDALALESIGQIDLVAGRALGKLDRRDRVAYSDHGCGRWMEETFGSCCDGTVDGPGGESSRNWDSLN